MALRFLFTAAIFSFFLFFLQTTEVRAACCVISCSNPPTQELWSYFYDISDTQKQQCSTGTILSATVDLGINCRSTGYESAIILAAQPSNSPCVSLASDPSLIRQATGASLPPSLGAVPAFGLNPFCPPSQKSCDIPTIIGNVIRAILGIVGTIALLMFVYGGFLWMTASGEAEKVKKAKGIVVWATLGIVVIFAAYMLINFIIKAIAP